MPSNPDKIKQTGDIGRQEILFAIARLPGTRHFFLGGSDFKVTEVDLAAPKPEFKTLGSHGSYVTSLDLAGNVLVSGSYDGKLIWWDTATHKQIRSVDAHTRWIRQVVSSPDGKLIASVADDMVCRTWESGSGKMVREMRGHESLTPHHFQSMLYTCAFSPDGKHLATADKVGKIVIWEVDTGKQMTMLEAPTMYTWDPVQHRHSIGGIRSVAFSPDGAMLAVGGMGKVGNIDHLEGKSRVELFDWRKGTRLVEYQSDKMNGLVNRLIYHPKMEWLLAAGGANDGFLIFLDSTGKKAIRQEKVKTMVHDAMLDETGTTIWIAGHHHLLTFSLNG